MVYRSERLIFREFKEEDFDLLYDLFSKKEVMKYTFYDYYTDKADLKPYFTSILANNQKKEGRGSYEFAIIDPLENRFAGIGDIVIDRKNDAGGYGEIGYILNPEFWGKGYGTETANKLLEIGFREIGLHRLYAKCNVNNNGSRKVMEKAGMIREGELREVRFKNGTWENEYLYAILVREWEERSR